LFAFLGFLTSALWINAAATEVVNILRSLGVVFRLSNTVLGLTLLAWGNSIGDVFSDFTLARQGYPRMAFSACFGGIIFNILVGVGLGCLLQISRGHVEVELEPDGLLVWVLAGTLGLSLVFSLVSVPLQCFQLNRVYGCCLLLLYLTFLLVALLTEFGVIHLKTV
ncbi:mitochondrial sodium/calcium exchanger protein-like, partial [Physeter macrocephalus]|uniref:Mitochondrial sodium/calcium exchanger protein-like n=1 Tax=Physeter macrocephalus TaxID=9755 RepID=A0A455B1L8_PHYMC